MRSSSTANARRLGQQVDLVQDDDLRPLVEPGAVERELAVDRREPLLGVALGGVDHVDEQPGALEVREELVAEPDALARALDQARARRRRSAGGRRATSTVPSTGASVVNG